MRRRILGFEQDPAGHWLARLECGHRQPVRHEPPWQDRTWVLTAEGRQAMIGSALDCIHCRK